VFHACYNRFWELGPPKDRTAEASTSSSALVEWASGVARKREDYLAGFCLVSKRLLDEWEYKVRYRFLLGVLAAVLPSCS